MYSVAKDNLLGIIDEYQLQILTASNSVIKLRAYLNGRPLEIGVYFEVANFQINIDDMVTLDKIEGQEITVGDVAPILTNFLQNFVNGALVVCEYKLLGLQSYSLMDSNKNLFHSPYETLSQGLCRRLGSKKELGILSVR